MSELKKPGAPYVLSLANLKKPGAPYVLSLANRLYGEQSYQFVEVRLIANNSRFAYGIEEKGSGNHL